MITQVASSPSNHGDRGGNGGNSAICQELIICQTPHKTPLIRLFPFICMITLWCRHNCHPHFIGENTEAHTAEKELG